jgi:NAD(P)-dependent dehydrogenase (short-subunit alcohol dehydrogenase family)
LQDSGARCHRFRSGRVCGADCCTGIRGGDVLVNNAGYGLIGAFEELSREQIVQNFHANLFGAMELIRVALPVLRSQGSGRIVNISAAAAISNYPGFSVYGATKWALEGLSESIAAELKPLGIHVTIVQPGPFRTDFIMTGRAANFCRASSVPFTPAPGKSRFAYNAARISSKFAGRVGVGFGEKLLRSLFDGLQKIRVESCPFSILPAPGRSRWDQGLTVAEMKRCRSRRLREIPQKVASGQPS